jgi:hypothetical protein
MMLVAPQWRCCSHIPGGLVAVVARSCGLSSACLHAVFVTPERATPAPVLRSVLLLSLRFAYRIKDDGAASWRWKRASAWPKKTGELSERDELVRTTRDAD